MGGAFLARGFGAQFCLRRRTRQIGLDDQTPAFKV